MKRCPKCNSGFPDTNQFCDLDGTSLVADYWDNYPEAAEPPAVAEEYQDAVDATSPLGPAVPPADPDPPVVEVSAFQVQRSTSGFQVHRDTRVGQSWKLLVIVAVAGVSIGIALFVIYLSITREAHDQNSNETSSNGAVTQQQIPVLPFRPSPSPSESPSPEPSPSPSPIPSPTAQAEPARVTLNPGLVSTGGDPKAGRAPVTIRLTDGSNVEADEVWETGEGIWYRRRGIVTLLERNEVKAIERAVEKASPAPASPVPASPAPTPTSSRTISP